MAEKQSPNDVATENCSEALPSPRKGEVFGEQFGGSEVIGNPRTELVYKFCGEEHAVNASVFNQNYANAIVAMKPEMKSNKFSSYGEGFAPNRIFVLAQCMDDLSKEDCEICFSTINAQLPGCFPHISGRVFFDGCFMRFENYSFFYESSSPHDVKVISL
ncbi:cysteine-rich receptor-like protein kinase 46 [Capsicum annuum]|uniref:cysteine-rich receptor-like protein kinase 46 n=1 Tax=Capsicum annuum TaxID=4072 RepID=UPI001FB19BCE|nr:cysteine-rich receptor-like protein kinase 46 [Capsicum annuum]